MDKGEDEMTDTTVKKKIQHTRLFSDTEKIELLVRLDKLPDSDRLALEEAIDGFDAKYTTSVHTLTDSIDKGITSLDRELSEQEKAQIADAALVVKAGLGMLYL